MPHGASLKSIIGIVLLLLLLPGPDSGFCLEPDEVLVIANSRAAGSLELARFYMERRGIPRDQLVELATVTAERCSREVYDDQIRRPVRKALARLGPERRIRCLVTVFGVPLAIAPHPPADRDQTTQIEERLGQLRQKEAAAAAPAARAALVREIKDQKAQLAVLAPMSSSAAVDSELMLALTEQYPLQGWLPNPYFIGFLHHKTMLERDKVMLVARLDGPDEATVRRIIEDTLAAEKTGLKGRACFDARWPKPKPEQKQLDGYQLYDASLHYAADRVRKSGRMEQVLLDEHEALFQAGDCPKTALYAGWYSLAHYVNAFTWVRGAIGFHMASGECTTLRQQGSQVWCKRMLEEGAAAVIGPVNEPYIQAFPLPEAILGSLVEGYLSLGESYLISLPFISWQMVLIGDPLYQPFASR